MDNGRAAGPVVVVTNPAAGSRRQRRAVPQVLARLAESGHPLHVVEADGAAQTEAACRAAVADGAAAVVAVGGDGTVHTALQAVAGRDVPLGVVPAGTGNDVAAAIGVPDDPLAAADAVAAALRTGTTVSWDLARMTDDHGGCRWYAGVLAAGFDAVVNERANRMRWPTSDLRYDVATVLELLRLRSRRYRLVLDGDEHVVDAVLVAVGNIAHYGGGIRICPAADPTDGLLDVVVGHRMGRVTLVRLRPRASRGTHVEDPLVDAFQARTLRIEADDITGYADGERCLPLPVTVECVPGALRVLSPPPTR